MKNTSEKRTQTRNKPTRSCLMCQRRKKKCDRKIPTCTECLEKGYECIYNGKLGARLIEGTHQLSRSQLIAKVGLLSSELREQRAKTVQVNPLSKLRYTSSKYGRVLTYGPTSFRCLVKTSKTAAFHTQTWKCTKEKRNEWKKGHIHPIQREEVDSVRNPLSFNNGNSVLEAVCACLPSLHVIKNYLTRFFDSTIFKQFQIIDPNKVLADLHLCLIVSEKDDVIGIELGAKKNYYRLGLITKILCFTCFQERVPLAIDMFHKFLSSFESAKAAQVERIQFFMLKYIFLNAKGFTGGDGGNCVTVVSLAFSTAVQIGLHHKENCGLFRDEPYFLLNLWELILQADLECAFSIGFPLQIGEGYLVWSEESSLDKFDSQSPMSNMQYIRHLREIINTLYSPDSIPNLELCVLKLKFALFTNFGSLTKLIDEKIDYEPLPFKKVFPILMSLQMISNLSLIQALLYPDRVNEMTSQALTCHLVSYVIVLKFILSTYNQQKRMKPTADIDTFCDMGVALYLYHSIIPRVTHEMLLIFSISSNKDSFNQNIALTTKEINHEALIKIFHSYEKSSADLESDTSLTYEFYNYFHDFYKGQYDSQLTSMLCESYLYIISEEFANSVSKAFARSPVDVPQQYQELPENVAPYNINDNDFFSLDALDAFDDELGMFFSI